MFSIGERSGLQTGQFSTRTLLLWSHAVVIAAVCGFTLSCWNTRHLEGSICCSKTFIYLLAFIVPSKTCKLYAPYRINVCNPIPSEMLDLNWALMTHWKVSLFFSPEDTASVICQECQIWTHLTIEHFSTLKQSILNESWLTGHNGTSGPGSHMASFLHDSTLVGICRCHGGLCLPTVVSGSIPGPI